MKKTLIVAATLLGALTANAQQPVGKFSITPKFGFSNNYTSRDMPASFYYATFIPISEEDFLIHNSSSDITAGGFTFYNSKSKTGITFGAEAQYQFTKVFALSGGVMYTQKGATYDTKGFSTNLTDLKGNTYKYNIDEDIKLKLDYLTIPILANVYVAKGLALKAGIQSEIAINKKMQIQTSITPSDNPFITSTNSDVKNVSTFGLSIPIGISYEYHNFVADARYNLGLTNIEKEKASGAKHQNIAITIGYKIIL